MAGYDYDLFTIGAGSGGVRASRMAASYGAKVAVAEEYRVGGTCVVRGCVPKKLFKYASAFADDFADAAGFGWDVGTPVFSWPKLVENKDREIDRLNGIYIHNLENAGVEILESRAILSDAHTICLPGLNRKVTAKHVLIATGGRPFMPAIPGIEHAISSNEAFHLPELPRRIAIVGSGFIAVEFAGIFHGLGVEVSLIYRQPNLLRGFDADVRDALTVAYEKKGIRQYSGEEVASIEKTGDGLVLHFKNDMRLETDMVMYATGRHPNTMGLGLEDAGVELGEHGEVKVDDFSRTSVDTIYAVGDVTNRVNLTPVAIREGAAFVETVFNNNPVAVDHTIVPEAVFSQPEIGCVGLSEESARLIHGALDIYKTRFRPMKNVLSGRDEQTLMKLVVEPESDRVLGVHLVGPDSAEMVQMAAIAVTMGATKAQFDATIALHPTSAEELVTLKQKWVAPV